MGKMDLMGIFSKPISELWQKKKPPAPADNQFVKFLNNMDLIAYLDDFLAEMNKMLAEIEKPENIMKIDFDSRGALHFVKFLFEEFKVGAEQSLAIDYPINQSYGLPSISSMQADIARHFKNTEYEKRFEDNIEKIYGPDKLKFSFGGEKGKLVIFFKSSRIELIYNAESKQIIFEQSIKEEKS